MRRTLRLFLFLLAVLVLPRTAHAHPSVSVVLDSRGAVYYSDLKQVWKIAPDGSRSVAVPGVHTHELWMDGEDNLYGEHLWYDGEEKDTWGHRVWRLGKDGQVTDLIRARQGFRDDFDDFHFVRDAAGAMYWVDRGEDGGESVVRRRAPGKPSVVLARARFRNVRWMTVTRTGTVYLVDLHDLVRVEPGGRVRTVVRNLAEDRRSFLGTVDPHAVLGLWTDARGNVYAAVASDREVKRITPDGRVRVVARSSGGWAPTGGAAAASGDLWVLEARGPWEVRVRRVRAGGR